MPLTSWEKGQTPAEGLHLRWKHKDYDQSDPIVIKVSPQGSDQPKLRLLGTVHQVKIQKQAKSRVAAQAKVDKKQQAILDAIGDQWMGRKQIEDSTGIPSTTLKRYLKDLVADGQLERQGENRNTRYRVIR
jgi:predicted HTH transcriptional regulator